MKTNQHKATAIFSYTEERGSLIVTRNGNPFASVIAGNLMPEQQAGIAIQIRNALNKHAALEAVVEAAKKLRDNKDLSPETIGLLELSLDIKLANLAAVREGGGK